MATAATARVPAPVSSAQSSRILIPLVIPFLILAGIAVYAAFTPYSKTNVPPPGARGSLVWGGAIFANERDLRAWLRLHGASYGAWVKAHPAAVKLVKPRSKHHSVLTKARKTPAVRKVATAEPVVITTTKPRGMGIWFVIAFGLILGALAATPHRFLARAGVHFEARERELRIAAIGAGAALLLGVIAATVVG